MVAEHPLCSRSVLSSAFLPPQFAVCLLLTLSIFYREYILVKIILNSLGLKEIPDR